MQLRNAEMVDLLRADFQFRYEPNFAWKSACSIFQSLNGLRGFWPMSSVDENADTFDLSGQGRTLSDNGDLEYGYDDLAPYVNFDGVGDYLSRADEAGLDILGTETYIETPGLTFGGWFNFGFAAAATENMIAKRTVAGNLSYYIRRLAAGTANFAISQDCTNVIQVTSTDTLNANLWYFVVGRFNPSAELKIWVNLATDTNLVAIPPSICNSTADLTIGAYAGGLELMTGLASMCFLCAAFLSDSIINAVFQQTRAMYGV